MQGVPLHVANDLVKVVFCFHRETLVTLACYPAAISPEPGNTTGRRRGGIAGR